MTRRTDPPRRARDFKPGSMRIVVTGAAGFLGRAIISAARKAGHEVTALVRRETCFDDDGVETRIVNLGKDLLPDLGDRANVVIHAAAGSGNDVVHARDTVDATKALLDAMQEGQRLVLVSSFSLYAMSGLPDGAVLDETSPTEPDGGTRDAYARAKIAQEKLAIAAAQMRGLDLWLMRPGAIYGPGRTWTARLGWDKGGRVICPGGNVPVPAIHVEHCAAALVAAATTPDRGWPDDLPIPKGNGHIRIVNLVDPAPPVQKDWLTAIGRDKITILPRGPLMKIAAALELAGDLAPGLGRRLPNTLGEAVMAARFKPLRYSARRAEVWLGHRPDRSFAEAMRESLR